MNYYYSKNGQTLGPLVIDELVKIIDRNTMVWSVDGATKEWLPAKDVPEINIQLIPPPPNFPVPPPPPVLAQNYPPPPPPPPVVIQNYTAPPPVPTYYSVPPPHNNYDNNVGNVQNPNLNLYIESQKKNKAENFQTTTSGISNIGKTFLFFVLGIIGVLIIRACNN